MRKATTVALSVPAMSARHKLRYCLAAASRSARQFYYQRRFEKMLLAPAH
jgi:hypothetical protein